MANLGICKRCKQCVSFAPALEGEDGQNETASKVWCELVGPGLVEWDSDVPEDCPYRMEHMVTKDCISDFAEEASKIRGTVNKEPK